MCLLPLMSGYVVPPKMLKSKEPKRVGNITTNQKDIMIEFLKKNPQLQAGKFSQSFTKANGQEKWKELATILNALGGAKKEWYQWRKTWHDMRSHTKTKKVAITKYRKGTGGGSPLPEEDILTPAEEAIAEMMGPTIIEGDQNVMETEVEFDLHSAYEVITIMQKNESSNNPPEVCNKNGIPNLGVNTFNSEANHSLLLDSSKSILQLRNIVSSGMVNNENYQQNGIGKNMEKECKASSTTKTPSKRIQRLRHTVTATDRLATQQKKHFDIMREYYSKKLKILEEDVALKRDTSASLETICAHLCSMISTE